ncbi:hypothetical protein [Rubrivivax sp. A210]|uniref:hypothetical protein n=1 Tax=Rubrivivax sp. A210 TaxID=2772301 RepID=UPI001918C80C|nr:hypothetical protein [Rubrivivax sp. A210]
MTTAGATDYCVTLFWPGPQDKPFYRAVLASPSWILPEPEPPFVGQARISPREFENLLAVLDANRLELEPGEPDPAATEYCVRVEMPTQAWHAGLGFEARTLAILRQFEAALDAANRGPVADIVARIQRFFP